MKQGRDVFIFNLIGYFTIGLMALACLLPFLLIVSGSVTAEKIIVTQGYSLFPKKWSLEAYKTIFSSPVTLIRSYGVTVFITITGTIIGLFLSAMTGYVLQVKEFKYRNFLAFFFYFTTLFSGGLVPLYILIVRTLDLKDNLLSVLLPLLFQVWFIFIIRNFMKTIPESINESAKIDGAGHFIILMRIVLPLSKPVLATIGLFIALNYWNNWYYTMLFIEDRKLYNLQYYLYRILTSNRFAEVSMKTTGIGTVSMPTESVKLAMTVVAVGPIIFLYPFVQRYFVKGITIGAVKG
jgi:putative aldouronate transport system permease protein